MTYPCSNRTANLRNTPYGFNSSILARAAGLISGFGYFFLSYTLNIMVVITFAYDTEGVSFPLISLFRKKFPSLFPRSQILHTFPYPSDCTPFVSLFSFPQVLITPRDCGLLE
jgi:hypothetical protein